MCVCVSVCAIKLMFFKGVSPFQMLSMGCFPNEYVKYDSNKCEMSDKKIGRFYVQG